MLSTMQVKKAEQWGLPLLAPQYSLYADAVTACQVPYTLLIAAGCTKCCAGGSRLDQDLLQGFDVIAYPFCQQTGSRQVTCMPKATEQGSAGYTRLHSCP